MVPWPKSKLIARQKRLYYSIGSTAQDWQGNFYADESAKDAVRLHPQLAPNCREHLIRQLKVLPKLVRWAPIALPGWPWVARAVIDLATIVPVVRNYAGHSLLPNA